MEHTAEIISVGTELLLGNVANTDARDISEQLSALGINVYYHTVVGDNPERLKAAVAIAKRRADIIITTGGLGPTCDDLTKQTLAEAFNKKLVFDEKAAQEMRDYFHNCLHTDHFTDNNYQQAYLPEGCTVFGNACGTAPGCAFEAEGVQVLMLPGPPRECLAMFKACGMPYLQKFTGTEIHSHNVRIFGLGESTMEDKLRPLMLELANPTLAPYAKEGECMLRLTAKAASAAEAETMMAPVMEKIRSTLGNFIYGIDVESLEARCLELLKAAGKTLATAESCTGGLVAKRMTDVPGASAVFLGGAVTYTNAAKTAILGVDADDVAREGPASATVAKQMAAGARRLLGADLGIGVTGIAGPASDETGLAVGTVFVALDAADGSWCRSLNLGHDRARIRTMAANHAFDMIRRCLTGLEIEKRV